MRLCEQRALNVKVLFWYVKPVEFTFTRQWKSVFNRVEILATRPLLGHCGRSASSMDRKAPISANNFVIVLFQNFAARIVYKRPDNPFHFLIDELEKSKREKEQSTSTS